MISIYRQRQSKETVKNVQLVILSRLRRFVSRKGVVVSYACSAMITRVFIRDFIDKIEFSKGRGKNV